MEACKAHISIPATHLKGRRRHGEVEADTLKGAETALASGSRKTVEHTDLHTTREGKGWGRQARTHARTHTHAHTHTHTHARTHARARAHTSARTYTRAHTRAHTHA